MNREEIIRMAREAGIRMASANDVVDERNVYAHELERFAALVAAAEREACAKECEQLQLKFHDASSSVAAMMQRQLCAYAIRARGEK